MPRPPQTESRSTPSARAACRTDVPTGKAPAPPGRREDDERFFRHGDAGALRGGHARPRPLPRPKGRGYLRIQRRQSGSCPIMTSAPSTACTTLSSSGLVIAEVSPAPIAMVRKALLIPGRLGNPKLTFEAPQVLLTPSSSRSRRTMCITWRPARLIAPIGMTSGIHHHVGARNAVVLGTFHDSSWPPRSERPGLPRCPSRRSRSPRPPPRAS